MFISVFIVTFFLTEKSMQVELEVEMEKVRVKEEDRNNEAAAAEVNPFMIT